MNALVGRSHQLGAAPVRVGLEDELAARLALLRVARLVDLGSGVAAATSAAARIAATTAATTRETQGAKRRASRDSASQRRPPANQPSGPVVVLVRHVYFPSPASLS